MIAMVRIVRRVEAADVSALLREAARLVALGEHASVEEVAAFRDRKIDILERIAAHPGPYEVEADAAEVARFAWREAAALRGGRPSTWGGL